MLTTPKVELLIDGTADVIVLPYFHMLLSAHIWPCLKESNIVGFLCPSERRAELQPVITAFRSTPYVDVAETDLFATVRLRPEFIGQANRLALLSSIVGNIHYPISIEPDFAEARYVLQDGWHGVEAHHVWSKSDSRLLLPVPKYCQTEKCEVKLTFWVFGASRERPVDIIFDSVEQGWEWSEKITAVSGEHIALNVPLVGATDFRSISISIPDATSPLNLIGSADGRILGIALQRIELVNPW